MQTKWLLVAVALFPDEAHWLRSGMLGSGLQCSSRAPFHFPGAVHYVMTFQDGVEVECGRVNAPLNMTCASLLVLCMRHD